MKFEKAILILPFSQAQFLNGKLGGEVILQEGETLADGLTELKRQCDEWYKKEFGITDGVVFQATGHTPGLVVTAPTMFGPLPEKNLAHEKIEIDIDNCTSYIAIEAMAKDIPSELFNHYLKKREELKQAEIKSIIDKADQLTKNK